jgi:hypothetical protein
MAAAPFCSSIVATKIETPASNRRLSEHLEVKQLPDMRTPPIASPYHYRCRSFRGAPLRPRVFILPPSATHSGGRIMAYKVSARITDWVGQIRAGMRDEWLVRKK